MNYEESKSSLVPVKSWTKGVQFEPGAKLQLEKVANFDIVWPHVAVMPDVHYGRGATVGSVVPTIGAIIPAIVGVDIGCGAQATRTNLKREGLPQNSAKLLYEHIDKAIPKGSGYKSGRGSWDSVPRYVNDAWAKLEPGLREITGRHKLERWAPAEKQLGTLGSGNHGVDVCADENGFVWLLIHSGSRGIGNRLGTHFIEKAIREAEKSGTFLPDKDLAYLSEDTESFNDYVAAVNWSQLYARTNRDMMTRTCLDAMCKALPMRFKVDETVDVHHNYTVREEHFGKSLWITRKGATSAKEGQLSVILGSMGPGRS